MRLRATKLSAIGFGGSRAALPSLDLAFALDKTLTARKGPTPTFSRASGATEIGSDGFIRYAPENLLTRSNDFVNADWTAERATVSSNTTVAPDGSATADKLTEDSTASNSHRITRQLNLSAIPYTFSVFAKASERSWIRMTLFDGTTSRQVWFDVSAGVIGTQSGAIGQIASFGNGWWRCSITATGLAFISSQTNIALATADNVTVYTGDGTSGLFLWGAQLERYSSARTYIPTTTAAVYGARFDHDPVTLASRGLLIEETRINTCTNSNLLTAVSWNQTALTVAPSGTAPDGSSAFEITEAAVNSGHALFNSGGATATANTTITAGTAYTQSVFFKKSGSSINWVQLTFTSGGFGTTQYANFDIGNGVTGNSSGVTSRIESFPNGWYRCSITATASAPTTGFGVIINLIGNVDTTGRGSSYLGSTANKILASLGQFEAGSFPTSYIPTTTTALTRSADVCSITGADFTSFWNQSEGSIFSEFSMISGFSIAGRAIPICQASNNTFNELIRLGTPTASLFQALDTSIGALQTRVLATTALSPTAKNKSAAAYKVGNNGISSNSSAVATSSPASISSSTTRFDIGALHPASGQPALCGHIARIQYFKKRLPDAKLQSLTTP